MTYKYGKPLIGVAQGSEKLFDGDDSDWDTTWEPVYPDPTATLWRYISFAKFCSLVEHRALFFSLVGDLEDQYEGFIIPPAFREEAGHLHGAETLSCKILHKFTRSCLVNCWAISEFESALMWDKYAGPEGVAIRTTFQDLQDSFGPIPDELPITFGKVEYVDYRQRNIQRFGWAPLFHKRVEFRSEEEMRVLLPGPPWDVTKANPADVDTLVQLDPDVKSNRGRCVNVDLSTLMKKVVLSPSAPTWFEEVVKSFMRKFQVKAPVVRSSIE